MPKNMDVHRLIAEIKKRPTLWNVQLPQYKDRTKTIRLWLDVADIMGCDVELCKRKWKNLRDAYRAEVRRTERRLLRLKMEGHADVKVNASKWVYFKPMGFMNMVQRKSAGASASAKTSSPNPCSIDSQDVFEPEAPEHIDLDNYFNVKMEPVTSTDEEADLYVIGDGETSTFADDDDDIDMNHIEAEAEAEAAAAAASAAVAEAEAQIEADDEAANDMLFEQFKSVATPQAARRLSGSLSIVTGVGSNSPTTTTTTTTTTATTTAAAATATSTSINIAPMDDNTSYASTPQASTCKCSERSEDQVHFLEDLEREEKKLMQSTRRDISRANSLSHFGDSDYNFLVSFLPQMKRLSELQNLQFRAKMSDLMLRIMAQPMAPVATMHSPSFGCSSTTNSCQQGHFDCNPNSRTPNAMQPKCQQQQNYL